MKHEMIEDDLKGEAIARFLAEHIDDMRSVSPPESTHALDLEALQAEEVTFWSLYAGTEVVGCVALKRLDPTHAEIKSMRTAQTHRRNGIGSFMLSFVLNEARRRGFQRLSLETGSMAFFRPARALYEQFGFVRCQPFGDYIEDPNSVFMTLRLNPTSRR
jgi:putative acetyltransferase